MKELGLFGAIIPTEYGGLGLSATTYAKIIERISSVWMSISGIINSHLIMAHIVAKMGTEEQRKEFLPRFATGELRGGLALTEPDCGTDLQAIRTTAVEMTTTSSTAPRRGSRTSRVVLRFSTDPQRSRATKA